MKDGDDSRAFQEMDRKQTISKETFLLQNIAVSSKFVVGPVSKFKTRLLWLSYLSFVSLICKLPPSQRKKIGQFLKASVHDG